MVRYLMSRIVSCIEKLKKSYERVYYYVVVFYNKGMKSEKVNLLLIDFKDRYNREKCWKGELRSLLDWFLWCLLYCCKKD